MKHIWKYIILAAIGFLATVGVFFLWNNVIRTPEYAKIYYLSPVSCGYQEKSFAKIKLDFVSYENSLNQTPKYSIIELPENGETKIIFYNTESTGKQLPYNEVINNPLIENIDYFQEGKNFVIDIIRRGDMLPAELFKNESSLIVFLKEGGEDYPVISDQKPANNSAAWPAYRIISFKAILKSQLKKASVFFQEKPVEFLVSEIAPNEYYFTFKENLEKDTMYSVGVVITDDQNRTNVSTWAFEGRVLVEAALGEDRFNYLGWWGEVNTNGISVREKPDTESKKLGTLSSINRIKVLKEVYGETISNNGLWYEIDGGAFPHSYVFSEYITPIAQPEPPKNFKIPEEVKEGENWIDVDLTKKILTLFEYDKPIFATFVALGREKNPTEEGTFKVWYKLKKDGMQGGPPLHEYKYDIKDIPSVMYYNGSFAIHGTFWHDKFGTLQSAGCTNMTQGDAAFIFENTNPKLKTDEQEIFSSWRNDGSVVYNHY